MTPKPRATQGASPTPLPSPTPTAGPQPAAFVGASVAPATVPVGGSVTFTVSVYHASRVEIYLYSPASSAPSETVSLAASGHTWTAQSVAPSIAGTYHFSVGIFDRTGHRSLQDNNGWNLTVTAAPTPTAAPTLPDDIVLSPPFNWGNPTPVSFNALGQSVSGDEILSDVRSGVDPSGIYDFYNNRLPRAGWTVQGGATTAPTTAGFGITATKSGPGRVIVVLMQQSGTGYQVTVEYGPLPTSG